MQTVSLESIVQRVVAEVIRELKNQGVQIVRPDDRSDRAVSPKPSAGKTERVDMTGYRTPVLTERHVKALHEMTGAVIVPAGTVVSPKARERLRDRNIALLLE